MRFILKILFYTVISGMASSHAFSLSPMWGYISLVAGEGDLGLKNGEFYSALFNKPTGLALDAKETRLFVADSENHCIRVIDLADQNKVETLAGDGKAGYLDGDFKSAAFNRPTLILFIPEERLLVYDSDNKLFRLMDLKSMKVSTVPSSVDSKGHGLLEHVFGMAFASNENAVYFTQPQLQVLKKLDLSSGTIKTFPISAELPNPAALCLHQGKLYASDLNLPSVYEVDPASGTAAGSPSASYKEMGKGNKIISMTSSGDTLYALQSADWPWVRITPNPGPVTLMSPWGDLLEKGSSILEDLLHFDASTPTVGFLADPLQKGSFYFGLPTLNCVISLKDYEFEAYKNSERVNDNGLFDFSYPVSKPPQAFRILLSGDSRLFYQQEQERDQEKRWPWGFNRMEMTPKRLELFLNTWASLNDAENYYEVLNVDNYRYCPLFLWPYFSDPLLIKKFDVDLVLLFLTNDFEMNGCFERPYNKDGIADINQDGAEFTQKTMSERLKIDNDKVLSDFYQRCVDLKYVTSGKEDFAGFIQMTSDPKLREYLLAITQKPLRLLAEKIKQMKTTAGKPVDFAVIYFPTGNRIGNPLLPTETYRHFWRESCQAAGIPFHDLTDKMTATRLNYFPITEPGGNHHFNHNGHIYFSLLVAQELMKEKLIPLGLENKDPVKGAH